MYEMNFWCTFKKWNLGLWAMNKPAEWIYCKKGAARVCTGFEKNQQFEIVANPVYDFSSAHTGYHFCNFKFTSTRNGFETGSPMGRVCRFLYQCVYQHKNNWWIEKNRCLGTSNFGAKKSNVGVAARVSIFWSGICQVLSCF